MERILNWMNKNAVDQKRISIAVGNENIIDFYKKFGFYPSTMTLEQK